MIELLLISNIVLWVLFLIVAVVLISVLRNLGTIYDSLPQRRAQGQTKLLPDQQLPDVNLASLSGESVPASIFLGEKTAITIISPTCSPCREILEGIIKGTWEPDPRDKTVQRLAVVSLGNTRETTEMIQQIGLPQKIPVYMDVESGVQNTWGIKGTPTTIIVDDQLTVVKQIFGLE